jgi:hypothetical protein
MNKIDHIKNCVFCTGDVTADVDQLHVKKNHLVCFSYIVIKDVLWIWTLHNHRKKVYTLRPRDVKCTDKACAAFVAVVGSWEFLTLCKDYAREGSQQLISTRHGCTVA